MKTLVTIGMSLHNSAKTLVEAVESVLKQDFPHELMEIIFVDDASEDDTFKIISDYAAKIDIKTKIFRTKWQGLGSSRNLMVSNSDADYIVWVDSDLVLPKSYITKQIEFMKKNPDVGITMGVVKTVPGNLILNLELIPPIVDHNRFEESRSITWKTKKLPGTGGSTFRLKALRQVNGFDEKLKGVGEDMDVAHRILDAGWSIHLNDAAFYEMHGHMSTWSDLFRKYRWYGFGSQKLYRRNDKLINLPRMSPIAGFVTGFFYSLIAYKFLHQKRIFFLLPLHFGLKMTAWMTGFIKAQFSGHEC